LTVLPCAVRSYSIVPLPNQDLVVVGGGSAGLTAAKLAGGTLGNSVVIIEENKLGGDCTWTGCVPSKSLLASAKAMHMARKQAIQSSSVADFKQVKATYRKNRQEIYEEDDSPEALEKFNVETISGRATLTSPTTLLIKGDGEAETIVEAKDGIVLCTGASPITPSIPGLHEVDYLTYEDVWEMKDLPKRLTIVGGGPIGCELAQAFARLGSKVTLVADRLLPREEPEVGEILREVFEDEGITIAGGKLTEVSKGENGRGHKASVSSGAAVEGDVLLVSVGRSPNVKNMGLETVGIKINAKGGIDVNDKLQTACKGVYAAGDCTGDRQFTHYAGFQGAIAARNILLPFTDPGILQSVPATTFTSPEVASIGYTEAQAKEEFGENIVGVSKMDLAKVDRAVCDGETKGFIKVLYNKKNGLILGATVMAPCGGELISEIATAMAAKLPFADLAKVIHPYPSYAIALQLMAADVYYENTMKLKWLYAILKRVGL
jgi:pyruvate/2-oxoglutarate dehydrogenase complex dihydrolipoamide dehydrogenase (E3) component